MGIIYTIGGSSMNVEEMKSYRSRYNEKLKELDAFFIEFGELDDKTYSRVLLIKSTKN